MLGTFHDGDEEEVVPTGSNSPDSTGSPHFDPNNNIYYGGDNTDGFIGQILTAEAINKTLFLINSLAYDGTELGMVDPATYNPANGTFVNTSGLSGGAPTPGNEISTINAGYITMVLTLMVEEFANTPLEQMAFDAVNAQASFLIASLQDPAGGFYDGFTISEGSENGDKTAVSQAAAARGLYAAYALTGNTDYLDGANAAYDFLIDNFYEATLMAFRTEGGNDLATYTPFNFAVIAGGLREAALVGGHTEAAAIYTRFFKKVANVMQLAEFDPSGETGNDSDGDGIPFLPEHPDQLAPVFATEAQLDFTVTGIDDRISLNEADVAIYPNPAKESATIGFTIEKASNVSVEAVDFTGKKVQTILNRHLPEGQFKASWNVNDLAGGIYFIRITVGASAVLTKKVVVL